MPTKKEIEVAIVALLALSKEMRQCDEVARTVFNSTASQLSLLGELVREDSQSINSLAEALHIHQSSASALGKSLVRRGLISRRGAKSDNRYTVLSLTAKGKELAMRAGIMGRPLLSAGLEAMPEALRIDLIRAVQELTVTMEKARDRIKKPSVRAKRNPSAVVSRKLRLA